MTSADSASPAVVVRTENLSVRLRGRDVLHNVNLEVRQGEVLAIIGPNGSGKSTLIKAIVGLLPPSSGRVDLVGTERSSIGYVPQRVSISSTIPATVQEIVASGLQASLFARRGSAGRTAVRDALDTVNLSDLRRRPVNELSGGQQQRALIARALVRAPEVLVLDEPLAGVDIAQQASFARSIAAVREQHRTIIVVLHEFGPLAPLITRVVSMSRGEIEYDASPEGAPTHCEPIVLPWGAPVPTSTPSHDHAHPHDDSERTQGHWARSASPLDQVQRP